MLEKKALPAADEAIAVAERQEPRTSWGKDQKAALLALLSDRRASIPEYAKAMRGDDLEKKLAATEHQRDLQRRAIDVVASARNVPP